MPVTITWIDGCWGEPDDLQLPLSDRGLQLADGLFETILVLDGAAQLLPEHLARWAASAELLGMNPPPSQQDLSGLIDEAIVKSDLHQASGALRLNWSRGSGQGRGIGIANVHQHRFGSRSPLAARIFNPSKRSQVGSSAAIATASVVDAKPSPTPLRSKPAAKPNALEPTMPCCTTPRATCAVERSPTCWCTARVHGSLLPSAAAAFLG